MKKYRLKHRTHDDTLLPWAIEQLYPKARRWCVIARFYGRSDGRAFLRVKKGLKPQPRRKAVDKELNWDGTEKSLADWNK